MNRRTFLAVLGASAGAIVLPEPPRVRAYSFAPNGGWVTGEEGIGYAYLGPSGEVKIIPPPGGTFSNELTVLTPEEFRSRMLKSIEYNRRRVRELSVSGVNLPPRLPIAPPWWYNSP